MLSKEAVEEYQKIYKKVFKEEIFFEDALVQGTKLVNLFKIIYRPIKIHEKYRKS